MANIGDLLKNIQDSLAELTTLNIWTVSGEDDKCLEFLLSKKRGEAVREFAPGGEGKNAMVWTQINLLQGDVVTLVPKNAGEPDNAWLMEYHSKREQQGMAIVHNNLRALRELWALAQEINKPGV